jgi:hypothetical protein
MRKAVGAGNHKTAVEMLRAADALLDAHCGHNPMVAAATTQCSRSPAPTGRKKNNRRNGNARSESRPPSSSDFFSFHNPGNGCANITTFMATKPTSSFSLVPSRKTEAPPNLYRFSGKPITCHCHSFAFPSKCRPHFLTDKLTNDRFG